MPVGRRSKLHVYDGQSLMRIGQPTAVWQYVQAAMQPIPHSFLVAVSATSYDQRELTAPTRVDPLVDKAGGTKILLDMGGTTDISSGLSAAQVTVNAEAYWDNRRAAGYDYIIAVNIPAAFPWFTAPQNVQRGIANTNFLASSSLDACFDIAATLNNALDPTYYIGDGLHLSDTGCDFVADCFIEMLGDLGLL